MEYTPYLGRSLTCRAKQKRDGRGKRSSHSKNVIHIPSIPPKASHSQSHHADKDVKEVDQGEREKDVVCRRSC